MKFVRDGKAIVQTDMNGLERYKLLRDQKQKEQLEIETIKKDILELKAIVKNIIGQLNG
tara:strand:- start:501 stop:677 length:177 start_codon:yes stop_codon:yes gene_type:complete